MAYTTINDPSAYFQTLLYAGNASQTALTNTGNSNLQPDFIWIQNRTSSSHYNALQDVNRGIDKILSTQVASAEVDTSEQVKSVQSDGFTVGDNSDSQNYVNLNSNNYCAWQWKMNGSASTNNDGSIASSVNASTTAGQSIITWTGTGSNGTIGHGLGVAPMMFWIKRRDAGSTNWRVYNRMLGGATKFLEMNGSGGEQTSSTIFNSAHPTSSVINLGTSGDTNGNGGTYVCHAFAPVKGYSKMGMYMGNDSSDGSRVFTGFKPAFLLIKCSSHTEPWFKVDSVRSPRNQTEAALRPDATAAENSSSGYSVNLLSDGFKCVDGAGNANGAGKAYIYLAFAEHPYVAGNDIIALAR